MSDLRAIRWNLLFRALFALSVSVLLVGNLRVFPSGVLNDRLGTMGGHCAAVRLNLTSREFPTAVEIDFTIEFEEPRERFCVPAGVYDYDAVPDSAMLELRTQERGSSRVEALLAPIPFVRFPGPKAFTARFLPSTQAVGTAGKEGEWVVPAGDYRLALRYRRAPCNVASEVCVVVSPEFRLTDETILPR